MVGSGWWWRGVTLTAASVLACSKPGATTEGPAEEVGAVVVGAGEVASKSAPKDEPGAMREGCPEGTVRVEGNETLQPFCMGETEVSVREFRRCVEAKACRDFDPKWDIDDPKKATWLLGDESMPINYVDEEQAKQYCAFVGGRLPTADEWIWAAGSAKGWIFPWGNEFTFDKDWFCGFWRRRNQEHNAAIPCSARLYPTDRTLQGVYDMIGSVTEFIGPNEKGQVGIMLTPGLLAVEPDDHDREGWSDSSKAMPWHGGGPLFWNYNIGIRCAADFKPR